MIKANELRIGNLVEYKIHGKDEWVVASILFIDDETGGFMRPILITEDILLKCGFTKWGDDVFCLEGFIDYWKLRYDKENEEWDVYFAPSKQRTGQTISAIKNLHQLQNLYFALTNEELNI